MLEKDFVQSRLANLLYELTVKDAASWVRRRVDQNYIYCFTNNEKIVIEVFVADDKTENCLKEPDFTFFIRYRDANLMYAGGICNADKLREFMKYAPVDDAEYERLNDLWFEYWQLHLLDDLSQFRNSLR